MNTNPHPNTSPTNKRKEIICFVTIMIPSVFMLGFTWIGLVILVNKVVGIEISAERVLLGIAALMVGGVWAWTSLKGKMPFAQKGESLPYALPTAQSPTQKLMRGLFVCIGIALYVMLATMPETIAYSLLRILSFGGRIFDTLGLLALFGMVLVIVIYDLALKAKQRLFPQDNPKERSPYVSWYVNALIYWIVFLVLVILYLFIVYRYM